MDLWNKDLEILIHSKLFPKIKFNALHRQNVHTIKFIESPISCTHNVIAVIQYARDLFENYLHTCRGSVFSNTNNFLN